MSFGHETRLRAITLTCWMGRHFGVQARDTDTENGR